MRMNKTLLESQLSWVFLLCLAWNLQIAAKPSVPFFNYSLSRNPFRYQYLNKSKLKQQVKCT